MTRGSSDCDASGGPSNVHEGPVLAGDLKPSGERVRTETDISIRPEDVRFGFTAAAIKDRIVGTGLDWKRLRPDRIYIATQSKFYEVRTPGVTLAKLLHKLGARFFYANQSTVLAVDAIVEVHRAKSRPQYVVTKRRERGEDVRELIFLSDDGATELRRRFGM